MSELTIQLDSRDEALGLFGSRDRFLKEIRDTLGVQLVARGDTVIVKGSDEQLDQVGRVFTQLRQLLRHHGQLTTESIRTVLEVVQQGGDRLETAAPEPAAGGKKGEGSSRYLRPRTDGQSRYVRAMRENDMTLCIGPAGTGKCVVGDTLVVSAEGLVPIEVLAANTAPDEYRARPTEVYGLDGPTWASHVYNGGEADTLRIQTRHGFSLEGTKAHPLLVLTPAGEVEWRPLEEIRPGDFVALARGTNLFGTETEVRFDYVRNPQDRCSRPVHLGQLDAEFAYFMGLMIGDGCLRQKGRIIFTSSDPALRQVFLDTAARWGLRAFPNTDRPYDLVIASHQLYALLLHVGLSAELAHEKYVPASILRAPRELVVAFLRGLFDTDGTVSQRDGYPSLATASPRLASQVQLLLLNLGVVAHRRVKPTDCRDCHILEMRSEEADRFFELVGFGLERKADRARPSRRNANLDLVPHVSGPIDTLVRAHRLPRRTHRRVYDYRIGRRAPSYSKLGELLALLPDPHPSSVRLHWLLQSRFLWSEVVHTEARRAQVYDLTVPIGHSFVAGGFVNHNTYLAVGMAVSLLRAGTVKKIVLVRPAVEAGERLGFLPGDIVAKVNPYLRPLFDSLNDMMEPEAVKRYMDNDIIEVVPLAYMRGRTLNAAVIILDEGQNTTVAQMMMFLTRMGEGSKIIVTGDVTQVDLPKQTRSGLTDAAHRLRDVEGIALVYLDENDIVRHPLVQRVLRAYEDDRPRKKKE